MTRPDRQEDIAVAVFAALTEPTRRAILTELATRGPATATDLAERLPISRQAITKHLGLLSDSALVTSQLGERRRVRYLVNTEPITIAQSFLAALAHDWDTRLGALQDYLQPTQGDDT